MATTDAAVSNLVATMPSGIPFYSLRHGAYVWRPGTVPVTQLYPDWDIFWVRAGRAQWEFAGGERIIAAKDEFVILPPSVTAVVSEAQASMAFWFCHFSFRPPPAQLAEAWRWDFRAHESPLPVPLHFSRREAPAVWTAYRDLARIDPSTASDDSEPWRLERALVKLIAALSAFARRRARSTRLPTREISVRRDPRIQRLCQRIEDQPAYPWRVGALAGSLALSPGRLNAIFRDVTGTSLKHFIVTMRLRLALRLLKEESDGRWKSVREVSEACGFSSQHFFSRQFRTYFGFGPLAYRMGGTVG
ncbi:MAG: helix-turn-helix transcriptional regulator [Planctomycetes bacterium]|nr:helix-turn-helix transcriptional regulator [Planctomycetota bacterium]